MPDESDAARIRQTILALTANIDLRDFAAVERLLAPEVALDYRSLWGGEIQHLTSADVLAGWRHIVPGFDATWHELGAMSIDANGDAANANCPVDARHWLGGEVWRLVGTYRFSLGRGERWLVCAMSFELDREIGSRALLEAAMARADSAD